MKVETKKPRDIENFLENLGQVRSQKKKASNLLFEEIEQDIIDKEKFVIQQTEQLKEMSNSYLMMLDYEKVLKSVQIIIPRLHSGTDNVKASMHGGLTV